MFCEIAEANALAIKIYIFKIFFIFEKGAHWLFHKRNDLKANYTGENGEHRSKFETPFHVRCQGKCGEMMAKGVRFSVKKKYFIIFLLKAY